MTLAYQLPWVPQHRQFWTRMPSQSSAVLYLADVTCVSPFRPSSAGDWQLRSADSGTLVVPRTSTISRRDFAVSGPATWNSFPVEPRTSFLQLCPPRHSSKGSKSIVISPASLIGVIFTYSIHSLIHSFIHSRGYSICLCQQSNNILFSNIQFFNHPRNDRVKISSYRKRRKIFSSINIKFSLGLYRNKCPSIVPSNTFGLTTLGAHAPTCPCFPASIQYRTLSRYTLCLANSFIAEVRPHRPISKPVAATVSFYHWCSRLHLPDEDCLSPANRYCPSRDMTSRMTSAHAQCAAGSRLRASAQLVLRRPVRLQLTAKWEWHIGD